MSEGYTVNVPSAVLAAEQGRTNTAPSGPVLSGSSNTGPSTPGLDFERDAINIGTVPPVVDVVGRPPARKRVALSETIAQLLVIFLIVLDIGVFFAFANDELMFVLILPIYGLTFYGARTKNFVFKRKILIASLIFDIIFMIFLVIITLSALPYLIKENIFAVAVVVIFDTAHGALCYHTFVVMKYSQENARSRPSMAYAAGRQVDMDDEEQQLMAAMQASLADADDDEEDNWDDVVRG